MQRFRRFLSTLPIFVLTTVSLACPRTIDQLPWDGRDGAASQNAGGSFSNAVRGADDFHFPVGSGALWRVSEVRAQLLLNWTPSLASFGMQVFSDTGVGADRRPNVLLFTRTTATSIIDFGTAFGSYRRYEVLFQIPQGSLSLPAGQFHWLSMYGTGAIPTGGSTFLATAGNGIVSGAIARANLAFPAGPWQRLDQCCTGATDLAIRVLADQSFSADFNCSGTPTVQDVFDFLAAFFANNLAADFDQSGALTVQDLFSFLEAYFAG